MGADQFGADRLGTDYLLDFIPVASAGLGLLLIGLLNLVLIRSAALTRLAISVGAGVATLGLPIAVGHDDLVPRTAGYLLAGWLPLALAGSRTIVRWLNLASGQLPTSPGRYALLMAAGLVLTVGAVIKYERDEAATLAAHEAEVVMLFGQAVPVPDPDARLVTDRGTPIRPARPSDLRTPVERDGGEALFLSRTGHAGHVIRLGPADERFNCHGWAFTGGRYLLAGNSVEVILAENGYVEVAEPRPGDLVIYRGDAGILHTGIVRYVTPGQPVIVEGKWGNRGLFLHEVDHSPYGTDYRYYRSRREGHWLRGVCDDESSGTARATGSGSPICEE